MHQARISFGALLLVASAAAAAATCAPKEYAQYKDQGNTAFGRRLQALEYCKLNSFANIELKTATSGAISSASAARHLAEAEQCHAEMSKIMTVFTTAKDAKAQKFAMGGCETY